MAKWVGWGVAGVGTDGQEKAFSPTLGTMPILSIATRRLRDWAHLCSWVPRSWYWVVPLEHADQQGRHRTLVLD